MPSNLKASVFLTAGYVDYKWWYKLTEHGYGRHQAQKQSVCIRSGRMKRALISLSADEKIFIGEYFNRHDYLMPCASDLETKNPEKSPVLTNNFELSADQIA